MTRLFANLDAPDDAVNATINTTPLVDVMLVLLIIFLITIPVVTHSVAVRLPEERHVTRKVAPQNVQISVNAQGQIFWNSLPVSEAQLKSRLRDVARAVEPPEIHLHGDTSLPYASIGRVVWACQQVGLTKLHFVTQPSSQQQGQ